VVGILGASRKGKFRRRLVATDEVAAQVARDHQTRAHFGAAGRAIRRRPVLVT
jgi:hypothetical protein